MVIAMDVDFSVFEFVGYIVMTTFGLVLCAGVMHADENECSVEFHEVWYYTF